MEKCKILIPVGCRSDRGLSAPIITRLEKNKLFDVRDMILEAGDYNESVKFAAINIRKNYDLVFITGDRIEMTAVASVAFNNHIPIAHFYGGVINDPIVTLDAINRHIISLWSDIQFVESKGALLNIEMLFKSVGKISNSFVVGMSHFDDIEIDKLQVPQYDKYYLVLYNPYNDRDKAKNDIYQINKICKGKYIIWIGPNKDPYDSDMLNLGVKNRYYHNLPRPQFLGLLKNCEKFITNSSAAHYEAPEFLMPDQIINIGDRNKKRTTGIIKKGASNSIIKILEMWWKSHD